jgi:23S rRNA (guanosine2251-2'-O)-methyltransferase
MSTPVILKNPHSILAALETRPQDVQRLTLPDHVTGGEWDMVRQLAQISKVQTSRSVDKPHDKRDRSPLGGRTAAAEAHVRPREPQSLDSLFRKKKGLWLALDCLQDPQNVGAIFRTASFFGVNGIIITQERSAPLTGVVYDVASGGVEYVPFCVEVNLHRTIEVIKEKHQDSDVWVLGTSEHAEQNLKQVPRDRSWLVVLGNEEKGIRRLTQEACDMMCAIKPKGQVTSLNVSVAAGVLVSHLST